MISIKNLRHGQPSEPFDIKVDRSSILGNPYRMSKEWERAAVCCKYERYFNAMVNEDIEFLLQNNFDISKIKKFKSELDKLSKLFKKFGQLSLWCWCAPLQCHAETIRNYLLIHY